MHVYNKFSYLVKYLGNVKIQSSKKLMIWQVSV